MGLSGIASGGAGFDGFIQQMLYLEGRPLRDLQTKRSGYNDTLSILSDIRTKVGTLKTLAKALGQQGAQSALRQYKVDSSNETAVTATADSSASVGHHTLTVTQLAQAHTIASSAFGAGGTTTIAAQTHTFEITQGGVATQISVEVLATDTNEVVLGKVRDAVRASGAKVSASVLTVDTTTNSRRLVLNATETGAATILSEVRDVTGDLATRLGIAGTSSTGSFSANTTMEGRDATFTLDAIAIASSSNEVKGVLQGIVLSLKAPTASGVTINLSIDNDEEAIKEKVDEAIKAYNELIQSLSGHLASGDETGAGRGKLAGDLTFMTFRNALKGALGGRLGAAQTLSGIDTLDDVGLSMARDGTLSLADGDKLFNVLATTPDALEAYFGSSDGIFARLEDLTSAMTDIGGGLDLARGQVESRREILDLRIERQEGFLELRERQLRDELGRLSQFAAQISAQQSAFSGILGSLGV
jgi:flagellar hook-associated protein 2